ncbi:MAG: nucleoside deaminase [Clostridia bacterium]|nr:nucleoside deaminase [Clostridia bacterium]
MLIEKKFMEEALVEARLAAEEGEVPVGAVVVRGGEIVSRAHNNAERSSDPSCHAELIALRDAAVKLNSRSLDDCALYVTMEPCPMCAGACLLFRIGAVVFGAYDERAGALGSVAEIGGGAFGQSFPVIGGVLREECAKLLTDFFKSMR